MLAVWPLVYQTNAQLLRESGIENNGVGYSHRRLTLDPNTPEVLSGLSINDVEGVVGEKTGSSVATNRVAGENFVPIEGAFNYATQFLRQPGSALGPLSVYAPAIDMGYVTPDSVENDSPDENGWPVNGYGSYRGDLTIREALRISSNTIPVKLLEYYLSDDVSAQFLKDCFNIYLVESMATENAAYTDISPAGLALGGLTYGVTTLDLASAYSVFPRGGVYNEPPV